MFSRGWMGRGYVEATTEPTCVQFLVPAGGGRLDGRRAPRSCLVRKIFWRDAIVSVSLLFDKYCPIIV
jgi:hypothetical protein